MTDVYTLWMKKYDDDRVTFLYTHTPGEFDFPRERKSIEELVNWHITSHIHQRDDLRFPSKDSIITTIPAIKRTFGGDYTEHPVSVDHLKEFEKLLDDKKAVSIS